MIGRENWKRMGPLALVLISGASCYSIFHREDLETKTDKLLNGKDVLEAVFAHSPMDILPKNLGEYFPALESFFDNWETAAPAEPPTKEQKRGEGIVPCKNVKYLSISCKPGSLATLEWIKVLFPKSRRLSLDIEGLPIQHGVCIGQKKLDALKMNNVRELKICCSGKIKDQYPSLAENLKLFPKLLSLEIANEPSSAMLEALVAQDRRLLPPLKCLSIEKMDATRKLLTDTMRAFPLLEKLHISGVSFCELTANISWLGLFDSPFRGLKSLGVDCCTTSSRVDFNAKMDRVFPSVSEIEIDILHPLCPYELSVPDNPDDLSKTITKVISHDDGATYPPSFFGLLFPNIKSVDIAGRDFIELFSNDLLRDKEFFARLEHLGIANNEASYFDIGVQVEGFQLALEEISEMAESEREPLAPHLKSLDIRNSACFADGLGWFSSNFPAVEELTVTEHLFKDADEEELYGLLWSLTRLNVELFTNSRLAAESAISGIRKRLEGPLASRLTVRFFMHYSSDPIEEPASFSAEPMDED